MQPFHEHHLCATDDHIGDGEITEYTAHRIAWRLAGYAAWVALALLFAWIILRSS